MQILNEFHNPDMAKVYWYYKIHLLIKTIHYI